MSSYLLYPRLQTADAERIRRQMLASDTPSAFSEADFNGALEGSSVFPATGGERIDEAGLRVLRRECLDAVQLDGEVPIGTSEFDFRLGRVLFEASARSLGEFGTPAVWDFLALVLLPDVVTCRFAPSSSGAAARYTGANRRHALRRLWRRWRVFGPEVVSAGFLTEDDYVALLERSVTSANPELAVRAAEAIRDSGLHGSARREFTRVFMRQAVQVSGLVDIGDDDSGHLDALFGHLRDVTERILKQPK